MRRERSTRMTFGACEIRRFELTEALTAGGSAEAVFVFYGSSDYEASTVTLTVHSGAMGAFEGEDETRGWCIWMIDSQRWEILQMDCGE